MNAARTVNVITTDELSLAKSLNAFPDDDQGNKEAERIFRENLNTVLNLDVTDDEAEIFIEDGYAINGAGWTCQLVHSCDVGESA
jgi:hypothetical protein